MDKFNFWRKWLLIASCILFLFMVMMSLFNSVGIMKLLFQQFDVLFWGNSSISENTRTFQTFIYGLYGAMAAAMFFSLIMVISYPFKNKENWAWYCIFGSLSIWFVLDSTMSVYCGASINVIPNILCYVLLVLPLLFTKKYFKTITRI